MNTFEAVITGAVQGLSEFLPISSSAHLVLCNHYLEKIAPIKEVADYALIDLRMQEAIFFDIIAHLATLIAVLIYFRNDLKNIFSGFYASLKQKDYENDNFKVFCYIALSTVITGVIGLCLKSSVEKIITNSSNIYIMFIFLMVTGCILLLSELLYKGDKKITLKSSILMAIAQGFAVFPGLSRSGLTICTALFQGIDRVSAARFSFLMSIPVILLASLIYPILDLDFTKITQFNLTAIFFGSLSSFIVGYLCIKYFMKLLSKISLKVFGFYCIILSATLLFGFFHH